MITDTPCANNTTVATLSGAPAMTTSSSSSSSNSSNSSTSSSSAASASSLVTTSTIGGNSGVLGVVGGATTVPGGGGGNSNLTGPGGVSATVATGSSGCISAGAGSNNNNQINCSTSLVGPISTGGNLVGQGGANIKPQQSSQQQLSPTQQQPLTPQQHLNVNVAPNTCTNNTTSCSNSITSSSNGNVTTTSISAVSGTNSISTNSTVSSLMHIKEEPHLLDTSKEDDTSRTTPPNMSGINIKKEPMQRMNSNGSANASGIIGSTNTGSLHHSDKNTSESDDRKPGGREGNDLSSDFDANFNMGVLGGKDDLLSENTVGMGGLGSLSNVKKEEPGPDLASDGFGSLGSSLASGTGNGSGNVNMPPGSGSCSGPVGGGRIPTGSSPSEGIQPLSSNILGSGKQGGVGGGGGLDYMQQQNHIFVFSTSLANKGAESVLSGQYPTIIAYHCAQPTTKKFLEDFFLKNPLKLSKMNRQNPVQWMNNSMPMMSKTNKTSNNSSGSNSSNNNSNPNRIVPTTKPPTSNNSGFASDDLPGSDTELLPWEQSGNHMNLDAMANGAGSNVNAPPTSDPAGLEVDNLVPGSPSLSANRSCSNHMPSNTTTSGASVQQSPTALTTSALGPTSPSLSGLQPSLQGVKVPDENLTPQQRQHREEQLAKLKKMNQFLFPEQGDFVGPPDGDPTSGVPPGAKMIGPGGPPGQGPVNMIAGMPGSGQMPIGGSMGGVPSLRGSGMLGIGPRAGMCRPMGGPMGPNSMPDGIMGGGNINDMSGMPCGVMMGSQQGPGGQSMMGGGNGGPPMGGMMPGAGIGQQSMVQGGPMGPGGPMNPCAVGNPMGPGMMGQNKHMMGGPGMAQMEWNKLQHQFYEERKGKSLDGMGMGGMCPSGANMAGGRQIPPVMRTNSQGGPRSQGPPPPYHQTQRSASVPIATQSPNPGSPNNPTSNLSLPSPRTGSTLNSPAGDHTTPVSSGSQQQQSSGGATPGRQQQQSSQQLPYKQDSPSTNSGCPGGGGSNTGVPRGSLSHNSNPSTPISSHLSPNASLKDLELGTTNSNSGGQGKEPNLMPVPSPQQIQYLNTFEGQELTIQKQPNTTLKDGSIISPPGGNNGPPSGVGNGGSGNSGAGNAANDTRISGTSTPLTPSSIEPRFPTTPGSGGQVSVGGGGGASAGSTFPIPSSPQTPNTGNTTGQGTSEKCQRLNTSGPSPQGSRTPSMSGDPMQGNTSSMSQPSIDSVRFPSTSPGINFSSVTGSNQGGGANSQQVNQMKLGGFMDVSPNGKCSTSTNDTNSTGNFCVRADNLPLNPNSSCPPPVKTSHFDPISSLAQMSQQLTSSVSNSLNGQPGGGGPGPGGGGNPSGGIMANFQNHGGMGMAADMSMGGHHVDGLMSGLDPCGMGGVMPSMAQYGMHGSNAGIPLSMMGGPGPRSLSPKLGGGMVGFPGGPVGMPHRMIGRPPMGGSPYNGANIQVKASTPNTIQYLPARPQVGNTNPRAPPSLEFLQRFANPMSSMDGPPNKVPSGQGMPFYPNCNQMGQPGPGGMGMNAHLDAASALGGPDGSGMLGLGGMGPAGPMMGQNLMMRGLRPPGQGGMVRMAGPPHMGGGGGGHHHHPFSNGPPNGPNDPSMFPGSQMFSTGSKGSPMSAGGPNGPGNPNHPNQIPGGGPPDASQPLPPTMGGGQAPGGGAFKSSQFVGPSTADPNYAQQYHNFQQQLYATSTRSQMSNQPGGGMAGGPTNPNQSFFVPK